MTFHCKIFRAICAAVVILWLTAQGLTAQEIVYLHGGASNPAVENRLGTAARFYGVELRSIEIGTDQQITASLDGVAKDDVVATVVMAEDLVRLPQEKLLSALGRRHGNPVPLLIAGISHEADAQLTKWSAGSVEWCEPLKSATPAKVRYRFGMQSDITGKLAGEEIVSNYAPVCSLASSRGAAIDALISATGPDSSRAVFARATVSGNSVFFLPMPGSIKESPRTSVAAFADLAPLLMFVRYAAGDYGWHTAGHYANFTIDDPWLTEPYGSLNYKKLLAEMERHNFHTTIAFVPWNFDRSAPEMISMFKDHPERYSIAIHGNNHDHAEFTDYSHVPLAKQEKNIQQAIARMERFHQLTGIPYERVMVFPHAISPEPTLAALKTYGFLATSNAEPLPLDQTAPDDSLYLLRAFTLQFGNFPSITRYSAERDVVRSEIAIQTFLDNPIVFYGHEKMFDYGITSFDQFADAVNSLQPDTQWCSLGCVAKHLYVIKRRADGNVDVKLYAGSAELENRTARGETYFVTKAENFAPAVKSLTVDGHSEPFKTSPSELTFALYLPPHSSRNIEFVYDTNFDAGSIDTSKSGVRIAVLRRVSDFRDMTLSQYRLGRWVTRFYYEHGLESAELKSESALLAVAVLLLIVLAAAIIVRRRSIKSAASPNGNVSNLASTASKTAK